MTQLHGELEALLEIARDLTASLAGTDRYDRLLEAVTRAIPCDAACLLRLQGDDLVPWPRVDWSRKRWSAASTDVPIRG